MKIEKYSKTIEKLMDIVTDESIPHEEILEGICFVYGYLVESSFEIMMANNLLSSKELEEIVEETDSYRKTGKDLALSYAGLLKKNPLSTDDKVKN